MPHVGNDGFTNCDKLCGSGNGYSDSCKKICPDMPHVGNDGFTNCDKLCGSGNGYSDSCKKICPEFEIPTEVPTVSTATIEPESKAPIDVTPDLTALIIIGYILAACVIAFAIICLIYCLWRRRRQISIKMSVQEEHRSTAVEDLMAAENGTMQQQPESNIPINIPNETDRLLLQVKEEVSNELTTLRSHEIVNPEKNLTKITRDQNKTSNSNAIITTLKRSGPDPEHDEYGIIQSIRPTLEPVYANINELQYRDGQGPREINSSMDSVNTTGTDSENDGDDVAYEEGSGVGSSENVGMTLVRVVAELRAC